VGFEMVRLDPEHRVELADRRSEIFLNPVNGAAHHMCVNRLGVETERCVFVSERCVELALVALRCAAMKIGACELCRSRLLRLDQARARSVGRSVFGARKRFFLPSRAIRFAERAESTD
jgi:hypothetical protein